VETAGFGRVDVGANMGQELLRRKLLFGFIEGGGLHSALSARIAQFPATDCLLSKLGQP
jgi:hypothetical protein